MKTDVKAWLETAGEPVAETCFPPGEAPALPYVVFLDSIGYGGADTKNALLRHSLVVERYSNTADENSALENLFDAAALKYTKDRQWLSDEECYLTIYDFETDIMERREI